MELTHFLFCRRFCALSRSALFLSEKEYARDHYVYLHVLVESIIHDEGMTHSNPMWFHGMTRSISIISRESVRVSRGLLWRTLHRLIAQKRMVSNRLTKHKIRGNLTIIEICHSYILVDLCYFEILRFWDTPFLAMGSERTGGSAFIIGPWEVLVGNGEEVCRLREVVILRCLKDGVVHVLVRIEIA